MKRIAFLLFVAVLLVPMSANAADPICSCYHDKNYCDLYYPVVSGAAVFDEAQCVTYCQATFGTAYLSESMSPDKTSTYGKAVESACTTVNAAARLAEQTQNASLAQSAAASTPSYPTPQLNVDIPGVSFAKALQISGTLSSNYLGEYVSGVYKFLIGFAFTVAVVMMMIGGVQYVIGASAGEIGKAKERIKNPAIGFVLLMSVVIILWTTNPQLTLFKNLQLQIVPPSPTEYEDDFISGATVATDFATPDGLNISGAGKTKVPSELTPDIESAATSLSTKGYGMSIASSFRSLEQQEQLIYRNCQNPPGSDTCDPKPGHATTCILKGLNPASCPHTTGRALDIWGTESGAQCITQDNCLKDLSACRANACQGALIAAMKAAGFCNLASEPWHFEKPKMSSSCN